MVELKLCKPMYTSGSPGDIIEAYPGSLATIMDYEEMPITTNPTNVFGYILGRARTRVLGESIGNPARGVLVLADPNMVAVERIHPLQENAVTHCEANRWAKPNLNTYLKIAELKTTESDLVVVGDPSLKLYALTNEAFEVVCKDLSAYTRCNGYRYERAVPMREL